MKKIVRALTRFFGPPKLQSGHPNLHGSFSSIDGSAEREAREHNQTEVAIANFEVTKEALQKNLNLVHWSLITSLLAVLVATIAVIVAFGK